MFITCLAVKRQVLFRAYPLWNDCLRLGSSLRLDVRDGWKRSTKLNVGLIEFDYRHYLVRIQTAPQTWGSSLSEDSNPLISEKIDFCSTFDSKLCARLIEFDYRNKPLWVREHYALNISNSTTCLVHKNLMLDWKRIGYHFGMKRSQVRVLSSCLQLVAQLEER